MCEHFTLRDLMDQIPLHELIENVSDIIKTLHLDEHKFYLAIELASQLKDELSEYCS